MNRAFVPKLPGRWSGLPQLVGHLKHKAVKLGRSSWPQVAGVIAPDCLVEFVDAPVYLEVEDQPPVVGLGVDGFVTGAFLFVNP